MLYNKNVRLVATLPLQLHVGITGSLQHVDVAQPHDVNQAYTCKCMTHIMLDAGQQRLSVSISLQLHVGGVSTAAAVQRGTLVCASCAHTATTNTMGKELQPRLVTRNVDQDQSMQCSLPRSISAMLHRLFHSSASNCAQVKTHLHRVLHDMATVACLCIDVADMTTHEATNAHQARLDSSIIGHVRIALVLMHLCSKKLGRRLRGRSQTVKLRLFVCAHYILPGIQCSLHPSVHEQQRCFWTSQCDSAAHLKWCCRHGMTRSGHTQPNRRVELIRSDCRCVACSFMY
jgi:hypothetical protein